MYVGGSKAYKGHRTLKIFKGPEDFWEKDHEKRKLVSLYGQIHRNQQTGPKENRINMQIYYRNHRSYKLLYAKNTN